MKKNLVFFLICLCITAAVLSSYRTKNPDNYIPRYKQEINDFRTVQSELLELISHMEGSATASLEPVRKKIAQARLKLKEIDFWIRYFEPIAYKKINGPLPVEWETEVFEKFEAPYRREAAGLTLAELYLEEKTVNRDSLLGLVQKSLEATDTYLADSITRNLSTYHHLFLANRLFLLNLAAIYTTGFECPSTENILPELLHMLESVKGIYNEYNAHYPASPVNQSYLTLYQKLITFVESANDYDQFDHFTFIKNFVNPLYTMNQAMILDYKVRSFNLIDFSLNKKATSIFDKALYTGQNAKGVFIGIDEEQQLNELKAIGKKLFFDPILSENNQRSCASCHKPDQFFTDTTVAAHFRFSKQGALSRNTPTLLNVTSNHLLMLDGKHYNLENQIRAVITNPEEMGSSEGEVMKKIMSCEDYRTVFKKYLPATPQYEEINLEHVASAIILYCSDLSRYYSPFDQAMFGRTEPDEEVKNGFNLFMSKAQCGTCHFVPGFNGVKPPYTGSEFEVIGTPADPEFKKLSPDNGRFVNHPAQEMKNAFRTGSVRNAAVTGPYMHNGVFTSLEQVIDFYDAGGGTGKGLAVPNQTLSSDSLRLTVIEKRQLLAFIKSLTEDIPVQHPPASLPASRRKDLNRRVVGGEY